MRSAQDQLERAQAKLARVLAKSNPTFPAAWARDVEQARADVAYWQQQAAAENQAGFALLTGGTGTTSSVPAAPPRVITVYAPPDVATTATSTSNVVMAAGAVIGIVALITWLRRR